MAGDYFVYMFKYIKMLKSVIFNTNKITGIFRFRELE